MRQGIDLERGRGDLDFGQGFYTTTRLQQAQQWAHRLFDAPVVLTFRIPVSDIQKLNRLVFDKPDETWVRFVERHRSGRALHDYDLVEGPYIANPQQFKIGAVPVAKGQQSSWHSPVTVELLMKGLVD
ncbi:DUF3990 domain-containing protein [Nocardia beijingensis]|uniref:DUF3990 domain-containing protein n=1 Tax=Nocardia beijingensis TaxID=95162 RepID=UPI0035313D54